MPNGKEAQADRSDSTNARATEQHPRQRCIYIEGGALHEAVDQAEEALVEATVPIYQMGGRLVALVDSGRQPKGSIWRPAGAPRLNPFTAIAGRDVLTRIATWWKWDARASDWRKIDCPMAVAAALVERGSWRKIPELIGYIEAPTLRPDLTPVTARGYDAPTGLYLADNAANSHWEAGAPSPADGAEAIDVISELVGDYPFAADEDCAAAIALILTPLVARSVEAVPMGCVTAPTPGTGKSYLVDTASMLATGRRAPVMSLGRDAAEAEKRLTGALLAGDLIISMDNVERPLEGDLTNQVISQPFVTLRPLGGSSMVRVPTRVALMATGNNLVVRGDLNRRILLVRLDAGMEHPECRAFGRDPLTEINQDRHRLIRAALDIPMAYKAAGCPDIEGHTPMAGFEKWDLMVRRPLMWLGMPDPLAPAKATRDDDPDRAAMRALYAAWRDAYSDAVVTAAKVIEDATRSIPRMDGQGRDHDYPDLHDAITQLCGGQPNARQLGYKLRHFRGRIADGLRLDHAGRTGTSKSAGWKVVEL